MAKFLLDTTVLSDVAKTNPEPDQLIEWVEHNLCDCFLSVLTLHELEFGCAHLSLNKSPEHRLRAVRHLQLNTELIRLFSGRVARVDERILVRAAWIRARTERVHKDIGLSDAIIAATAEVAGACVVTGNVVDFCAAGIPVMDSATLEMVDPPTLSTILRPDAFKRAPKARN